MWKREAVWSDVSSRLKEIEHSLDPGALISLDRLHDTEPGALARGFATLLHKVLVRTKGMSGRIRKRIGHDGSRRLGGE